MRKRIKINLSYIMIHHSLVKLIFNLIRDKINKYKKVNVADNILYFIQHCNKIFILFFKKIIQKYIYKLYYILNNKYFKKHIIHICIKFIIFYY